MLNNYQFHFGLVVGLVALSGAANSQTSDKKDKSPWEITVGAGVASAPEYEGAKKRAYGLIPDANISYKTDSYGTLSIGTNAKGISWTAIDKEAYSFGVSLGLNGGRTDTKDGSSLQLGSKFLNGMGQIKQSLDYSVFGHYTVGVPIAFQVIKNAGKGTINNDRSIEGSGGIRAELSVEIPLQISDSISLSIAPNAVWADKKYTQTYFGVSNAQADQSGFSAYLAKGGISSIGLRLGANYKFTPNWSANVGLSISSLRGDAAKSPIVQSKSQFSSVAGLAYNF